MKLAQLNKEELKRRLNSLEGNMYWAKAAKRDRQHWAYQPPLKTAANQKLIVRIKKAMKTAGPERNAQGNAITRCFVGDLEQVLARQLLKQGFYILSQGSFHQVLAHDDRREVHTLCEGDHIQVMCPTEACYDAEISVCRAFYEQH